MSGHLVSAPVSRFHIGEGTDVEPAHFWLKGPLVNFVRSWELIIKHDLTHRFHGQTVGVLPSIFVPHRFGTGPLLEPGSICDGVRRWQFIIKPDFTHLFDFWTLGVHPTLPSADSWYRKPSRRLCPGLYLVEPGSTCEWSQKEAIEYKT